MRSLTLAATPWGVVAAALLSGGAPALAAPYKTVTFYFPEEMNGGQVLDYGFFGDGSFTGQQILSTRLIVDFETTNGSDAGEFYSAFLVPVILDDPNGTELFEFVGADAGWSGEGRFDHFLETDAYNGLVRFGRFSWEFHNVDFEEPMSGIFHNNSRIEFDVVPAPGALALLGLGALGAARRRR